MPGQRLAALAVLSVRTVASADSGAFACACGARRAAAEQVEQSAPPGGTFAGAFGSLSKFKEALEGQRRAAAQTNPVAWSEELAAAADQASHALAALAGT